MTAQTRHDRQLTDILEELYLGRAPAYEDEVVAVAVSHRQRAAWTFPGRWLPMVDITGPWVFIPRVPWRTIGLALLLLALLLATVLVAGSRRSTVPSPFGVARNGVIAYAIYGDIHSVDVVSGAAETLIAGRELDSRPVFSRDGSRLAFLRSQGTADPYQLMVAAADGTGVRPVAGSPVEGMDDQHDFDFEWTADGRSLVVYVEPRILVVDAVGSASPVILSNDAVPTGRLGPNGLIPYQPASITEDALWALGVDGSPPRELLRRSGAESGGGDLQRARYSPDGTMIAFERNMLPEADGQLRIFIANADGTGARRLTDATGLGLETDLAWSPDSRFIAFNRWEPEDPAQPGGNWVPREIGVAAVGDGAGPQPVVPTGPSLGTQGADFEWSPDGSSLIAIPSRPSIASRLNQPLVIDVTTGEPRTLDVTVNERTNWQRVMP